MTTIEVIIITACFLIAGILFLQAAFRDDGGNDEP
jgi:hypothetical protein